MCLTPWLAGLSWRRATGAPGRIGHVLTSVVSAGLAYLPFASLTLVAYAVWRIALLSRLQPGAHIDAPQAKILLFMCVVVLVLQSVCLSLVRGEDRRPDFSGKARPEGDD